MRELWTALVANEYEPFAAFVPGHLDILEACIEAEDNIVSAFRRLGDDLAGEVIEILDEAGGAVLQHFWLRPERSEPASDANDIEFYHIATPGERGAIPVTGVRFM